MIVGLTGGVGSGKSTVLEIFRELGCRIISADDIAHDILRKNKKVYNAILEEFGEGVLSRDKSISRKKLGGVVFADKKKRKKLESITLPVIISGLNKILALERMKKGIFVAEVPLLFETGMADLFDRTVVVWVMRKIAIKRLRERDKLTLEDAGRRIEAQMPLTKKKRLADYVINNNPSKNLLSRIKPVYEILKEEQGK